MRKFGWALRSVVFAAALLGIPSLAMAEEAEFYLEPVIVTAAKYDETERKAGYYEMDEAQLAAGNYENALEVIQQLPGVTLVSRGASSGMNGYSSILLNGSDRYVVVVDGVRSNWNGSSSNDFDFSVLPADMLSSVEILPAAAGAVYGNAAKGGVIKITTKKAVAGVQTNINLETGSYGRERESLLHFGKSGDWSWSVYGQKSIQGDYSSARHRIESHENTAQAKVRITKSWGEAADLTLDYSDFSGRYTSKIFNFKREEGTDQKEKRIFLVGGRKTENNIALEYDRKISDAERNVFGIYRRGSDAAYDDNPAISKKWLLDLRTSGFFDRYTKDWHPRHTLTGGLEYYQDQVLDYQDLMSNYSDRKVISKAVYVQNAWQMDDAVKVTGSLRQDYNSYAGSALSPALALEYRPAEQLLYTLSSTKYFAPPKQLQLFAPYGSTALKPEEGTVHELGVAYMPDRSLTVKANVFHRDATNVIGYHRLTPLDARYANIAREKATGFTLSVDKQFSEHWRASVAYSQTKVSAEAGEDAAVLGVRLPHGELLCNLLYERDAYTVALQGRGVFDQANGRGENLYAENTYWVWNASLHYKVNQNAKLYLKVNNIFDQFYSNWENDTDGFLGFDEWYAEPGRNYQIGVSYTF